VEYDEIFLEVEMTLLPTTYLGPIEYYARLLKGDCVVECCNSYEKQTYANRCRIMASEGVMDLTVPVAKPWHHVALKDVRIAYDEEWQAMHSRAIKAAYGSAPFYEYFAEFLAPLYEKKWEFLIDFDRKAEEIMLKLLRLEYIKPTYSEEYVICDDGGIKDLRKVLHPKKNVVPLEINLGVEYYQVFTPKFGFIPNLSVLDLVMNMGNESRIYLKQIIK